MILKLTVARIMIWKNSCCIYMPKLERMTLTVYFKKLNKIMSCRSSTCVRKVLYTQFIRARLENDRSMYICIRKHI